jgi:hypothetical protein
LKPLAASRSLLSRKRLILLLLFSQAAFTSARKEVAMKRALVLAVLLSIPTAARSQESYSLKLPVAAKGDVSRVEFSIRQSFRLMKLDAFNNEIRSDVNDATSGLTYVDTILDQVGGQTTRFRRQFERAVQTVDGSDSIPMFCHGKTVLVEVKDGKTQVTWEGGDAVPDSFARQMEQVLKGSRENFAAFSKVDPLPALPVKVGDTWTVDISNLVSDCESKHGCEVKGASGSATLQKVETRGSSHFAVMTVKVHVPLKCIVQGEKRITLQEGCGMTWESTYDFCIDGTSSAFVTRNHFHFLTAGLAPEHHGLSTRLRLETDVDLNESRSK